MWGLLALIQQQLEWIDPKYIINNWFVDCCLRLTFALRRNVKGTCSYPFVGECAFRFNAPFSLCNEWLSSMQRCFQLLLFSFSTSRDVCSSVESSVFSTHAWVEIHIRHVCDVQRCGQSVVIYYYLYMRSYQSPDMTEGLTKTKWRSVCGFRAHQLHFGTMVVLRLDNGNGNGPDLTLTIKTEPSEKK